ncbi:SRPBCC domain-containing protein [Candidatus Mycobacterium methanotrophicum]|uniref:SRPBCC domain-containing protein n=1 Tax=Candidatus Mycobacterium methanotrophicum TaxID=2943498 RepID=A0ABY4QJV1_9MYCO|nr:SRPBCC domain-containing protein [Candidatus Mycobacterium methanotrophicum]UQX10089.1 SRPBCC domain-containing protein [Candidatus Mycobacterium methanotrophicum]
MTEFWPTEHSIGASELADVVIEPRTGGRWFERGVDGSECQWGRVAAWDDPPRKVVLLWQIGVDWQFDPEFETEVEVTFSEEGPGRSRLDLRHRNLQRYGDHTDRMRAIFDGPSGWTGAPWPDSSTSQRRKPRRVTEASDAGHVHDAAGVRGTPRLCRLPR